MRRSALVKAASFVLSGHRKAKSDGRTSETPRRARPINLNRPNGLERSAASATSATGERCMHGDRLNYSLLHLRLATSTQPITTLRAELTIKDHSGWSVTSTESIPVTASFSLILREQNGVRLHPRHPQKTMTDSALPFIKMMGTDG